jgi:hypothetical protein
VRKAGYRAPAMCPLTGSFIPFAATKAERTAKNDPRRSLQERYGNHEGYVSAVKTAAQKLVGERFLLPEDAETYVKEAEGSKILAEGTQTR